MRIERFEDIRAWQAARELANLVYDATNVGAFAHDFGLRDQIRDAARSVMDNIAEGFDSASDDDFIRFLVYSRRSANEVQSQCYIGLDRKYISEEQFQTLYCKATDAKKLINAFIGYLRK